MFHTCTIYPLQHLYIYLLIIYHASIVINRLSISFYILIYLQGKMNNDETFKDGKNTTRTYLTSCNGKNLYNRSCACAISSNMLLIVPQTVILILHIFLELHSIGCSSCIYWSIFS